MYRKVLTALKDDPFDNPDNETFKPLITKIDKNARFFKLPNIFLFSEDKL